MSSMFKKKGALAFKPKIPSARPRPAASITTTNINTTHSSSVAEAIDTTSHIPNTRSIEVGPQDGINTEARVQEAHDQPAQASTSHQNPTPPPSINESLIAPELRDKPADHPEPSAVAEATQESPSPDAETRPAKAAAKPRAPRTRARRKAAEISDKEAAPNGDGDGDGAAGAAAARPKKRQRKAPAQAAAAADGADEPPAPKQSRQRKASSSSASRASSAKPRRARSLTPEDAETQTVDLQKLRMTDLTKDLHIGKKFSRHDELRDRERAARLRAKLKGGSASRDASETPDDPAAAGAASASSSSGPQTKLGSSTPTPADTSTSTPPGGAGAGAGPQFRIVDGQIIVDQSSLVMDRHARANAARGAMETVEENDFTRLITSNSFMTTSKLRGPNIWTDEETELFYRGLRMFGTEFEMISRMFPNKQRRHVKLKYNREERHCPERITATICGVKTDKIDIDEYKLFTGMEFETVESIEAEHRRIQEGFEAEQQRAADEQAEIMRRKREELFADDDNDSNINNTIKKKGKKRGKQAVAYGLNGEPIMAES
ncbi:Transcription factor TFIIIB component B'' [Escovopsis weberi]|uniref:Transcription factor TFIIIB component B n=1 Tax=Escovopsis weberi TaxID=150374 RepID=A0A0M8MQD3_ESCWE|nr:Transcription factor TFIIIB component B'' [Escovopsis weberi]